MPFGRLPRKAQHLSPAAVAVDVVDSVIKVNWWANKHINYRPEKVDRWSAPLETYKRQCGDCEDIAILKHAMLNALDVESWVVIVKDRGRAKKVDGVWVPGHHAITVTSNLVLDLRPSKPQPIEAYIDYTPMTAFTATKCWLYGEVRDDSA